MRIMFLKSNLCSMIRFVWLMLAVVLLGSCVTVPGVAPAPPQTGATASLIIALREKPTGPQSHVAVGVASIDVIGAEYNIVHVRPLFGRVRVRVDLDATTRVRIAHYRKTLDRAGLEKVFVLYFHSKGDAKEAQQKYALLPDVADVTLNVRDVKVQYTPNDLVSGGQWHLANNWMSGAAEAAWNDVYGSSGSNVVPNVVIAVLDTGVDMFHPDLSGNLIAGWNTVANNANAQDNHGHGTHVAGIATANGDNNIPGLGVAYKAQIMPVKTLSASGNGTWTELVDAIDFAVINGADIINMSLGGATSSALVSSGLAATITAAENAGVILIAAAGNTGWAYGDQFPAAYPEVVSVAAVCNQGIVAPFSTYINDITELAAPGVLINSTALGGGTTIDSGTSMAAPFVSGAAALLLQNGLPAHQVRQRLRDATIDAGPPGYDAEYGYGIVDLSELTAPIINIVQSPSLKAVALHRDLTVSAQVDQLIVSDSSGMLGQAQLDFDFITSLRSFDRMMNGNPTPIACVSGRGRAPIMSSGVWTGTFAIAPTPLAVCIDLSTSSQPTIVAVLQMGWYVYAIEDISPQAGGDVLFALSNYPERIVFSPNAWTNTQTFLFFAGQPRRYAFDTRRIGGNDYLFFRGSEQLMVFRHDGVLVAYHFGFSKLSREHKIITAGRVDGWMGTTMPPEDIGRLFVLKDKQTVLDVDVDGLLNASTGLYPINLANSTYAADLLMSGGQGGNIHSIAFRDGRNLLFVTYGTLNVDAFHVKQQTGVSAFHDSYTLPGPASWVAVNEAYPQGEYFVGAITGTNSVTGFTP